MKTIRLSSDGSAATVSDDPPIGGDGAPALAGSPSDVKVWAWTLGGRTTLCTCFERRDAKGYRYVVITPSGVKLMPLNRFMRTVAPNRQELSLSQEWRQRIWDAYQESKAKVMHVLHELHQSDAQEVVPHA